MPPERVVDVLALVGDAVDNVPGVPGIGDKGARDLVREFGSVEAVLENADKVKRAAYREGLKAHRAEALLSKQLVTLRTDVPVDARPRGARCRRARPRPPHALFKELEFQALAQEFAPEIVPGATATTGCCSTRGRVDGGRGGGAGRGPARARRRGHERAGDARAAARASRSPGRRPLGLRAARPRGARPAAGALPASEALALLRPLLEDPAVRKVSAHAKRDRIVLGRLGVALEGLAFDALLASLPARSRAGAPTGSRTWRSSSWASGAAPGTDGVARRGRGRRRDRARRPAPRPSSRCGSSEPMSERLETRACCRSTSRWRCRWWRCSRDMERAGVKVDTALLAGDEPRHGGAAPVADRPRSTRWPRASSTSTRRSSCARCSSTGWA